MNIWSFDRNPSENQWDAWQKQVSMLGLDYEVLTRRMDSNQKAIAEYIEYRALHDRYPGILTRAQRIDKAATHSFRRPGQFFSQVRTRRGERRKRVLLPPAMHHFDCDI
jgi:hypothetical protein